MEESQSRYIDTAAAARYLGVSVAYLNIARNRGIGPPFIRPNGLRKVIYDRVLLDDWMSKGVHRSTAEYHTPEAHRARQSPGRPKKSRNRDDEAGQLAVGRRRLAGKLRPTE